MPKTRDFKKQLGERQAVVPRAAIPQVDPEAPKPSVPTPTPAEPVRAVPTDEGGHRAQATVPTQRPIYLTPVHTDEQPTNRGFAMYPSRHTQVVRDLAFIEGRRPWQIIEDALEEYVTGHYGDQFTRR